jgi:hypothetical protein
MGELQLWVDQDYQNAHFITHYGHLVTVNLHGSSPERHRDGT